LTDFRGRIFAAPRSGRHRPWRGAAKLVGFALALASARGVLADRGSSPGPGVRFVASLSAPPLDAAAAGAEYADLRVEQTISAHAGEVDFYGPVRVDLGAFAARDGAPERII